VTTKIVQEFLYFYPPLYTVTLVLKEFNRINEFDNAYYGGISSYCLTIMIVALLRKDQVIYCNFGRFLMDFLKYYGYEFDPTKTGISLNVNQPFFEHNNNLNIMNQQPHLQMFDCLYLRKYIAPKSTRIMEILQGFRDFHDELNQYRELIKLKLKDYPNTLNMNVNSFNLTHVEQILQGNILEKTLKVFKQRKGA